MLLHTQDEDAVRQLSIHALRVELQRRGLPIIGMKSDLRCRLKKAITNSGKPISVPSRFKRPLPDDQTCFSPPIKAVGYVMGRSVWVLDASHMNTLWTISDAYGKGNLSRSAPNYLSAVDVSVTRGKAARQLIALEKHESKTTGHQSSRDGIEHLQLTLVEAYHATFHAQRLQLLTRAGDSLDDASDVWNMFSKQSPQFALRFAAYARYRATGWMPRSGLKYGVDWVLYPLGLEKHTHAPYCVIISCSSHHESVRLESSWIRLQNKLRLVKNVAKSLIVAQVCFEEGYEPSDWEDAIENVRISEITVDRWVA